MLASTTFDLGAECRLAAERFRKAMNAILPGRQQAVPDPGVFPENVVFYLPYALAEAFPFEGALEAVRTMVVGNLVGEVHFLVEDEQADGESEDAPDVSRLSDFALLLMAREYGRLFPTESPFWNHFWRYLREYFESLDWELAVLRSERGLEAVSRTRLDETFLMLGRRASPLKACAAAVAMLAGREDALPAVERIVEDFHTAYQLSDDLEDLAEDLETGSWSAAAWLIAARGLLASPRALSSASGALESAAASGALDEIAEYTQTHFRRAADGAREIGAPLLESYMEGCAQRSGRVHRWMARRLAVASASPTGSGRPVGSAPPTGLSGTVMPACPAAASLHRFTVADDGFAFDPGSGLLFEVDALAMDVLDWVEGGSDEAARDVLEMDHGSGPLNEALAELSVFGRDAGRDSGVMPGYAAVRHGQSLARLVSVALNVSGDCNLCCDYCYLSDRSGGAPRLMSEETAELAIDMLFAESFGARELSVVFFGGEPLLNPRLIEHTTRVARERAAAERRRVRFHTTTNGTLLTPDLAATLGDLGVGVLVSVDGARDEHDTHRRMPDGHGSYDVITGNVSAAPEGLRLGARATVTEDSRPLPELVGHLKGLGFGVVHLAPVSGPRMAPAFAERLVREFDELARGELRDIKAGAAPSVGNFIEPVMSLEIGRQRLLPCGAGSRYVSVDHDGRLFLCHRFAGDGRYAVGDVRRGLDRSAAGVLLAGLEERSAVCRSCWARDLCGGACFHDVESGSGCGEGAVAEHLDVRCRIIRRVLELSMWLYASLPDERRARLTEAARRLARPEALSGRGA